MRSRQVTYWSDFEKRNRISEILLKLCEIRNKFVLRYTSN